MIDEIVIKPIGLVHSERVHRYETPRQGVLAGKDISVIKLNPSFNFEQALKDLEGFERIWVIYWFHLNNNWKPIDRKSTRLNSSHLGISYAVFCLKKKKKHKETKPSAQSTHTSHHSTQSPHT